MEPVMPQRALIRAARAALLLAACAAIAVGCRGKPSEQTPGTAPQLTGELRAVAVDSAPVDDPAAAEWRRAGELSVVMIQQTVTHPQAPTLNIPAVRVRALVDPSWLVFRIQWDDESQSDVIDTDLFTDAVAVQLPLGPLEKTNPMMGDAAAPVYIAQWMAAWQRDIDHGRWDVQDRHPNFWSDGYPFASGAHPYPIEDSFQSAHARRYLPGVSAGNPVSRLHRRWPVEELEARGFGTVHPQGVQDARGRGVWADGAWSVVIAIPRHPEDPLNPRLPAGDHAVGFAVWEGGASDVGGRKQWAPFTKLVIP
jgi:hypothetical protein